jgi:alpha-methylacyl-CoA racemase
MGPLEGIKIIEIGGIGPGPYCGMLLAEMGASVVRIERPAGTGKGYEIPRRFDLMNRSRPAIGIDLKESSGVGMVLGLCEEADAIFEGYRPGVMERLGLGPEECLVRNPALVFGRVTGWGQDGPLAVAAGHDPNYIGLTGVLASIGEPDRGPLMPLNLVADMGGGSLLAMGILAALLSAARTGKGQVVDAAMIDSAASQMTLMYGLKAAGRWSDVRGSNILDGGAPFARPYRTADGQWVIVAPIENHFFRNLLDDLGINDLDASRQFDESYWPVIRKRLEAVFMGKSRDEWCDQLEGTDTCFAPVLSMSEAPQHAHNLARKGFVDVDGITQPGAAPRFSRTPGGIKSAPQAQQKDIEAVLEGWRGAG